MKLLLADIIAHHPFSEVRTDLQKNRKRQLDTQHHLRDDQTLKTGLPMLKSV